MMLLPKRSSLRPAPDLPRLLLLQVVALLLLSSPASASASDTGSSVLRLPSSSASSDQEQQQSDTPGPCDGAVARPPSCPVRCFRPDPVCGADGVTYWCGCADAACSGARVAKTGFCQDNGAGMRVSGQAFLLLHTVWLFVLGFSLAFGLF